MAPKKHEKKTAKNGANLGFEQTLWQAADKLRGNMDASDYKHVVLGLIFLKYISDAFEERHAALKSEPHADPEDRHEYSAENVFCVPKPAHWPKLQAAAKEPGIGKLPDEATLAIEKENQQVLEILNA
jgi:type I restriction enzyme M protein